MLDMERHALICLQACVERLHGVPQQVAPLFERGLVHFAVVCARRVGQLVDWADRDILDEVLVECHGCAVPSILQASVHLGQEVLLDVDVGPALREVLPDVEDGVSPKSGLEERILLADQIENQSRELAQLARNDVLRHLVDEHRHELQTGGPHTASVAFTEEGPHVVLFLGHLCLLGDSSLPSSQASSTTASFLTSWCSLGSVGVLLTGGINLGCRTFLSLFRGLGFCWHLFSLFGRLVSVRSEVEHVKKLTSELLLLFHRPAFDELE